MNGNKGPRTRLSEKEGYTSDFSRSTRLQVKGPTKMQHSLAARRADFDLNMKPVPGFKFHKPGSENPKKGSSRTSKRR